jgi:hypothetical protein
MSTATTDNYTYDILIEAQPDGTHQAIALGWADCRAIATTAEEAVGKVKEMLSDRIAKAQIVRVEVHPVNVNTIPPVYQHPWMQFAEKLKDNPLLDEVEQYIAESRQTLDANQEAEV